MSWFYRNCNATMKSSILWLLLSCVGVSLFLFVLLDAIGTKSFEHGLLPPSMVPTGTTVSGQSWWKWLLPITRNAFLWDVGNPIDSTNADLKHIHLDLVDKDQSTQKKTTAESAPGMASYLDFASQQSPISVTYDKRSFFLNGKRTLLFSGSIHPVRHTKGTWILALEEAVAFGCNAISIYLVWGYHQPFQYQALDWTLPGGDWTLVDAIEEAALHGLFVHARVGPYIDAEYTYGGLPEWIGFVPRDENDPEETPIELRRQNKLWKKAMEGYVTETIQYFTDHNLWAHQGGPILFGQIENELGADDEETLHELQQYADWCGSLVERLAPNVTWTMCSGLTAPNTITTCNGDDCVSWLEHHGESGRIQVDQPPMWTEDEAGFQVWGESPESLTAYFWGRTGRDFARATLRWLARGGTHLNYYMFVGGYNRGRSAGAGITNMYASDAVVCPSGSQRRQPKFDHLRRLHQIVRERLAPILLDSPSGLGANETVDVLQNDGTWKKSGSKQRMFAYQNSLVFVENDDESVVEIRFKPTGDDQEWVYAQLAASSAVVVLDGEIVYDSSRIDPASKAYKQRIQPVDYRTDRIETWPEPIGVQKENRNTIKSSRPVEHSQLMIQTNYSSDFIWYETEFKLDHDMLNATLTVGTIKSMSLSVFLDGRYIGNQDNHEKAPEQNITFTFALLGDLKVGRSYQLAFLSESLGYSCLIGRWSASTRPKTKGLVGQVLLSSNSPTAVGDDAIDLANGDYTWKQNPDLNAQRLMFPTHTGEAKTGNVPLAVENDVNKGAPCCYWTRLSFRLDAATYPVASRSGGLYLDMNMGEGHLWLNGKSLGRFWNITRADTALYSQRYYHLPWDWLHFEHFDLSQRNVSLNELQIFQTQSLQVHSSSITDTIRIFHIDIVEDPASHLEDEIGYYGACPE